MEAQQLARSMMEILRRTASKFTEDVCRPRDPTLYGRVPSHLREDDWHPFDPKVVSIGPLHMGKPQLERMQELKWVFMTNLLQGHSLTSRPSLLFSPQEIDVLNNSIYPCLENCVSVVHGLEEASRGYYSEEFSQLDKDAFTNMLVLDACFLIEWCCNRYHECIVNTVFPGISMEELLHDFLLIENQIPFDVLKAVHLSVFPSLDNRPKKLLEGLRRFFFPNEVFTDSITRIDYLNLHEFYCENLCQVKIHYEQSNMAKLKNYVCYPYKFFLKNLLPDQDEVNLPMVIKTSTAAECDKAGIHIKATNRRSFIPHIMFTNGTLTIACIHMNHLTYSRIRNITFTEKWSLMVLGTKQPMSDYVGFLCSLVKSEADYKVLEEKGVVSANSRAEGILMFHKLKRLPLPNQLPNRRTTARYIRDSIERYVAEPHHRWRVNLLRDYFSSPWSIIGLVVGFVLLGLSVLQTVYTILGYYNNKI